HNLEQAGRLVRGAALQGAKLIVLPECFAWTGPEGTQRAVAESLPEGGPVLARCQSWARELGVELILGGFWERADDATRVHNTSVHLGRDGSVKSSYRKIHLFDVELADGTSARES